VRRGGRGGEVEGGHGVSGLPISGHRKQCRPHLARKFSAISTVVTIEITSTTFNLDESITETFLLTEEGVR
jgi:hypothetical protein